MTTRKRFKKALSVLSWNVKHFGRTVRDPDYDGEEALPPVLERPVGPIVDFIAKKKPDVLAIYEVVGAQVFDELMRKMPGYQFFVTEGEATQEILVGVRRKFPAFFTQRLEFRSGQSTLRPGALLTVEARGERYTLLFLHLKSMTDPKGFGLRDDMTERALRFYSHLCASADGPVNYLFLGDLNTMGMNVTYDDGDICATDEIERLRVRAEKRGMRLLEKTHPFTYWPGSASSLSPGDLDHVVVAGHLAVRQWRVKRADWEGSGPLGDVGGRGASRACAKTAGARVLGWPELVGDSAKDEWVGRYSDHGGIWVEVG